MRRSKALGEDQRGAGASPCAPRSSGAITSATPRWWSGFLSQRGKRIRGFKNHLYTGFPTATMARLIGDLLEKHPGLSGLYQVASPRIDKLTLLEKLRDACDVRVDIEPFETERLDRSLDGSRFATPRPALPHRAGTSWCAPWPPTWRPTTIGDGSMLLKDKSVLITGGTGRCGKVLVRRLLSGPTAPRGRSSCCRATGQTALHAPRLQEAGAADHRDGDLRQLPPPPDLPGQRRA